MMKMMKRSSPSSSSSLSFLYVMMVISLVCTVSAQSSFDCGSSALNSLLPTFTTLSVFPSTVQVGQQVHIRTVVYLPENAGFNKGDITDGQLSITLSFKNTDLNILNIPLCNASSAIDCSTLGPGDNAISFDYLVPEIPAGLYDITLRAKNFSALIGAGCLTFSQTVIDPDAPTDKYVSWIEAELAGASQFEHSDYMQRSLNEYVQVGPIGSIDANTAYTFPWGTFISIKGSGDFVQPYFSTGGYVWGLSGEMTQIVYQNTTRSQLYEGQFFVGWVSSLAKRTLDVEILTGTFALTWNYTTDVSGVVSSILEGSITFDNKAELPFGFSNPVAVGMLGTASIITDSDGVLKMTGTQNTCLGNANCNNVSTKKGGDGLTHWQIGLIVAVLVGVALIFIIVISVFNWHRRSKRHEEEDGIFAVRRKPEYGNALVVDDIIQETREHSPNIMPPLARRDVEYSDSDSDDDFTRSRSRSRTPSRSRSRSPYSDRSKSRSRSRSAGGSDSESDYTDAGSSASRA